MTFSMESKITALVIIFETFSSGKNTINSTESSTNPKNIILWVGIRTDFYD